jgi:cytochrome P450
LLTSFRLRTQENQDELFGFILAGFDSTSSAISWFVKYIADNPAAQTKLRQQLHSRFAQEPTAQEIVKANLPYLDAVIEE